MTASSDSHEDEEVCFGMLNGVRIQLIRLQRKASNTFDEVEKAAEIFLCPKVVLDEYRCDIQSREGNSVATLNKKAHSILRSLFLEYNTQYQGLLQKAKFVEKLDAAAQPTGLYPSDLEISMSVLVFGLRSVADRLAKALSRHRLFLQHPSIPTHKLYENPQYPLTITSSSIDGTTLCQTSTTANQVDTKADFLAAAANEELENPIAVINNLPRHDYLNEAAPIDDHVRATLLPHQKEAVDFAMRREGVGDMGPRSLWCRDDSTSACPIYIHTITGFRSSCADDMLGGILADDMGLGKSLTMIVTIVMTMTRAENFVGGRLRAHHAAKTPKIPVKSTLIVVPSPSRCLRSVSPPEYDVVLTTYGTVVTDFRRGGGVLDCFHWYRLVLDEAHVIRNWSTKQYNAVTGLSASIRWCLTGTPIQNTLYDLESLLKFLQVPHFDNGGSFRKYIIGKQKTQSGVWKPDYENLKKLLGVICLRRSTSVLALHGVEFVENRPRLSEAERRVYNGLAESCKQSIDAAVSNQGSQREHAAILVALLRLRMFCSAGKADVMNQDLGTVAKQLDPDEIISLLQQNGDVNCMECGVDILALEIQDGDDRQSTMSRSRLRCLDCVSMDAERLHTGGPHLEGKTDPIAGILDYNQDEVPGAEYSGHKDFHLCSNTPVEGDTYLSKLNFLLADVKKHYSCDKSIIFSSWKQSLTRVGRLFDEHDIRFCQVNGDLRPPDRRKVLKKFCKDPDTRVLLMTLGTGGVGLNELSVASRVHLLEPQWNPSVEGQAIGRVFRLGQGKKVCVIRLLGLAKLRKSSSLEEAVFSLQTRDFSFIKGERRRLTFSD
ncbi:MAG: hypothetical protein M1821_006819 [Bathelium mastoideum]|nr:MAG: hypothetical protein M1821_006819 [Bathelium mastoideum]